MHIHLNPNIPKRRGNLYIFMKSEIWNNLCTVPLDSCTYCCDITDIRRMPPERATYTKLMKPLINHIS